MKPRVRVNISAGHSLVLLEIHLVTSYCPSGVEKHMLPVMRLIQQKAHVQTSLVYHRSMKSPHQFSATMNHNTLLARRLSHIMVPTLLLRLLSGRAVQRLSSYITVATWGGRINRGTFGGAFSSGRSIGKAW